MSNDEESIFQRDFQKFLNDNLNGINPEFEFGVGAIIERTGETFNKFKVSSENPLKLDVSTYTSVSLTFTPTPRVASGLDVIDWSVLATFIIDPNENLDKILSIIRTSSASLHDTLQNKDKTTFGDYKFTIVAQPPSVPSPAIFFNNTLRVMVEVNYVLNSTTNATFTNEIKFTLGNTVLTKISPSITRGSNIGSDTSNENTLNYFTNSLLEQIYAFDYDVGNTLHKELINNMLLGTNLSKKYDLQIDFPGVGIVDFKVIIKTIDLKLNRNDTIKIILTLSQNTQATLQAQQTK